MDGQCQLGEKTLLDSDVGRLETTGRGRPAKLNRAKPMREWQRMLTSIDGTGVMTEPESQRGGLFMQETAIC